MIKLVAAIIGFGGWREHLNNNSGIEQSLLSLVEEFLLTTDRNDIRIRVERCYGDLHLQLGAEYLTRLVLEQMVKLARRVCRDTDMLSRSARHCIDAAIDELALVVGCPFESEVLFLGKE